MNHPTRQRRRCIGEYRLRHQQLLNASARPASRRTTRNTQDTGTTRAGEAGRTDQEVTDVS